KNLLIREYTSIDRRDAYKILTDPETMSFWPSPFANEQVEAWLSSKVDPFRGRGIGRFAVVLRKTNQMIGDAGIVPTEVNGQKIIGLFQGMFEKNILTFNPGLNNKTERVDGFTDVREIQKTLEERGIELDTRVATESGPGSITFRDPDGNPILIDQFF
ncbi:MAG: GNAT family N-acetyltransferase, partial [Myxococcota bacterium]